MNRSSVIWPGYYDVVILPPAPVRDHAIDLSLKLRQMGGQWRLGTRAFLPHISLYHIPILEKDVESFLDELQHIVDSTSLGELETTGLDMPVMTVSNPDWLKRLHRRVVSRTVRYFNRKYQVEKLWNLHRFSGRRLVFAKKYLREFGTPMAGMNFRPHITLSSFKDGDPADSQIHIRPMRFRVDRLYVCELGISHSCHRIVHELVPRIMGTDHSIPEFVEFGD